MRTLLTLLAPIAVVAAPIPAGAHSNIEIDGRVAAIAPTLISVTTLSGTIHVPMNGATKVLRAGDSIPATISDVKVGQLVTVIGYGDSEADMVALGVIIKKGG